MSPPQAPQWHWASEQALCLSLPPPVDAALQRRLLAMAEDLRGRPGVLDAVPGLHNLTLYADPQVLAPGAQEALAQQAWARAQAAEMAPRERRLPVHYGGADGPDLEAAAAHAGLSPAQFIEAHAAPRYLVACLGFLPGFPYLLGLPSALQQPRRASPRLRVPAGSVGIGGVQTGVYPLESPGGWQLIGRTRTPLLDAATRGTWLLPGDTLVFEPCRA